MLWNAVYFLQTRHDGALHAEADSRKRNLVFPCELCVIILPSIPRDPNPGATRIPFRPFSFSFTFSFVISSEWIYSTSTLHSFAAPLCMNDSEIDLYASGSSTYFPTSPTRTECFGCLSLFRNSRHSVIGGFFVAGSASFLKTV